MSINSPLKIAKGLGSVKEGAHHFWVQRVSALALIPLTIWFVVSILGIIEGGRWDAMAWISQPLPAFLLMLFIGTAYYHAYQGMKTVVEDYIHCECGKIGLFIIMQLGFFFMSAATIFSILRIYFEG
jgi:succinate dehydrogenase / fumarate reductase membrane anchor subunit